MPHALRHHICPRQHHRSVLTPASRLANSSRNLSQVAVSYPSSHPRHSQLTVTTLIRLGFRVVLCTQSRHHCSQLSVTTLVLLGSQVVLCTQSRHLHLSDITKLRPLLIPSSPIQQENLSPIPVLIPAPILEFKNGPSSDPSQSCCHQEPNIVESFRHFQMPSDTTACSHQRNCTVLTPASR